MSVMWEVTFLTITIITTSWLHVSANQELQFPCMSVWNYIPGIHQNNGMDRQPENTRPLATVVAVAEKNINLPQGEHDRRDI